MTPKFRVGQVVQYYFNDASLFHCPYFPIKSIINDEEGIKYEDSDEELYDELDLISLKESYEKLKVIQNLIENQIKSAEYLLILKTKGEPRFKLGDRVYCNQQDGRDQCEFPITKIFWSSEDDMYVYSNDADETFSAEELTLVKKGQRFSKNSKDN